MRPVVPGAALPGRARAEAVLPVLVITLAFSRFHGRVDDPVAAGRGHPGRDLASPSYGIIGPDSIAYPFNEACSIKQQYSSYVEAWIYDMARDRSTPVVIHLVCKG